MPLFWTHAYSAPERLTPRRTTCCPSAFRSWFPWTRSAETPLDGGAVGAGVGVAVGAAVGVGVAVGVGDGTVAPASPGRRITLKACQFGDVDVSVAVGATTPTGETTRVELRRNELPPPALRVV